MIRGGIILGLCAALSVAGCATHTPAARPPDAVAPRLVIRANLPGEALVCVQAWPAWGTPCIRVDQLRALLRSVQFTEARP